MSRVCQGRYTRGWADAIQREAVFRRIGPPRACAMDLRCPNCHSADLKEVSLAYQEGLFRVRTKSRLRALLFGEDGPNVIVGTAVMRGTQQTELSRALCPPKKWSFGKILLAAGIVSIASLIFYTNTVMSISSHVSGVPVVVFGVIGLIVLFVSLAVIWRHNLLVYPRQCAEWERSFVCQRCGAVSRHDLHSLSLG